jgi:hypothetical protein
MGRQCVPILEPTLARNVLPAAAFGPRRVKDTPSTVGESTHVLFDPEPRKLTVPNHDDDALLPIFLRRPPPLAGVGGRHHYDGRRVCPSCCRTSPQGDYGPTRRRVQLHVREQPAPSPGDGGRERPQSRRGTGGAYRPRTCLLGMSLIHMICCCKPYCPVASHCSLLLLSARACSNRAPWSRRSRSAWRP